MKKWRSDNQAYMKRTFQTAWPAVIESFFVAFVGMVDSLMVSKLGEYAVAAVGLTTQPKFMGLAVFIAVNVAVSALVARRKGEENREGANRILMTAVSFVVLASIIVSLLCVVFASPIIQFSGAEADTHDSAVLYFRIIMGCMIFNTISLVINAAQRGSGNTKIAMRTNLTSNLVNVAGNYLLINGNLGFPALGVQGAALATVLGTIVACGMSIASLFGKNSFVSIPYSIANRIRISFQTVHQIYSLAVTVFAEQICLRLGFFTAAVLAAKLGTQAFAAHQVGLNVMSLSFSFGDGMQVAAVTLIGQSLGRREPDKAKQYGHMCQRMGNVISIVLSALYLVGGEAFYRMYFTDEGTIQMGVMIMRVMVIIVLMQIPQVIYMGCLRGAGDVKFTMIVSIISVTLIRPITGYLFAYTLGWGLIGIWLGVICDQIVRMSLTSWRFATGKWMNVKI